MLYLLSAATPLIYSRPDCAWEEANLSRSSWFRRNNLLSRINIHPWIISTNHMCTIIMNNASAASLNIWKRFPHLSKRRPLIQSYHKIKLVLWKTCEFRLLWLSHCPTFLLIFLIPFLSLFSFRFLPLYCFGPNRYILILSNTFSTSDKNTFIQLVYIIHVHYNNYIFLDHQWLTSLLLQFANPKSQYKFTLQHYNTGFHVAYVISQVLY